MLSLFYSFNLELMSNNFAKDWFGRRKEEAYTYQDNRNRFFNWDSGRSSYSSFFTRSNDSLQTSAKMIGSMFRVIGVPKTFDYVAAEPSKNTQIQIPIHMLKDDDGKYREPDPEILDAFYGAAIQNAALASMQTTSEYGKSVTCRNTSRSAFSLKDYMFSILNTERIDKKLSNRLPGYLKFVQKYKDHLFDKNHTPVGEEEKAQKRLLDLITRMLRYPANVTEEELSEFDKPLKQIERLLKKHGGIPETSEDCSSMASSLANIVYKYVEEEEEPPGGGSGGDDDSEGGDDESKGGSSPSPSPGMSKSEVNEFAKEMMESTFGEDKSDESDSEQMAAFNDFVDDMTDEPTASKANIDYSEEGIATDGNVKFIKSTSNKSTYQYNLKKIDTTKAAVLQKLFARKSKDYQFAMRSMRSGRLDTNKIAEAVQRVPTVYERYGSVKTDKICVGVLIDESGSMCGSKIQKAREAAIFINEVFRGMRDVELFIYGHTADEGGYGTTQIRIYREPGFHLDPYALGAVEARSNNRDGDAIIATAKRIRKQTANQGIVFVLSDGQPSAYDYGGQSAIKDTRDKVSKAQNLGFQVIQIAIEEAVPSKEMFDYYIKMTDIKNLPRDMVGYMSRKVDKLIKERVTL
jgi:Mg-chelatase subunit ChlD